MQQVHFIKMLYNRFYPQNNKIIDINKSAWESLNLNEKIKLADKYLQEGEILLAKKDLSAIEYFQAASYLNPNNEQIWLRQGKALLSYGKIKNQEKAYYLANKNFKIATSINPDILEIWWQWAQALVLLGQITEEASYLHSAKEKYEKAIELSKSHDKDTIAKIYWEYANLWMEIANTSEEAGDVRLAIGAYRLSFAHQTQIQDNFWFDFGKAYLQMGLFINDNRLYLEAIEYFNKALRSNKNHLNSWISKAHAYTELYINTLDERAYKNAHESYKESLKLSPNDSDLLLLWAQLLCESVTLSSDKNKLKLSVSKCIEANKINKKDPLITGQWVESLASLGQLTNDLEAILESEEKIIKAVNKYPKISELWYSYGICLKAFSHYYNDMEYVDLAIEKFKKGLSIDKTSAELWHALALSYTEIGISNEDIPMLKKASQYYLKAIDLKPSCPSLTYDYGNHLLKLGEISENKKTLEQALFYLESTLNNQKDAILQHPNWLFSYGCALDLLGDCLDEETSYYDKALKAFNNVLLIDPDYPLLHYRMGLCYSHLGELNYDPNYYHSAINSFNLALRQNDENDLIYLEWGLTLISLGETEEIPDRKTQHFKEAEQKILRSGQLGNQHAYYHLACLYSLLNRFEECVNLLKKAEEQEVLPSIEELMEDIWLDNVRSTKYFKDLINMLETKQNMVDGH